jgi:hypothetical protein
MTATIEHNGFNKMTSLHPEEQELLAPGQHALTPHCAAQLKQKASLWLSRAQKEFHDAIFSRDGSEESLERYASARAELDSAEAWALSVSKAVRQQRD